MPLSQQRLAHFIKTEPVESLQIQGVKTEPFESDDKQVIPTFLAEKRNYQAAMITTTNARRAAKRARNIGEESSDGETSTKRCQSKNNMKEKERAKAFNSAFDQLRQSIPSLPKNKKLSKIEVLRLAICYMAYLQYVLHE